MELLYDWLNKEVKLSIEIDNIDSQFANGYLLGELLHQYNQQLDFVERFQNSDMKHMKVRNFVLIFPVLKSLEIKFTFNDAADIIANKPGKAIWLLRQLKDSLERLRNSVDVRILQKTGQKNQTLPLKKINTKRVKLDAVECRHFKEQLQKIVPSENSRKMKNNQARFTHFMIRRQHQIEAEKRVERELELTHKAHARKQKLEQVKRHVQFKEEWCQKIQLEYKRNMKMRKATLEREKEIMQKNQTRKDLLRRIDKKNEKHQTLKQIEEFDKLIELKSQNHQNDSNMEEEKLWNGFFLATTQMKEYKENGFEIPHMINESKEREKELFSEGFKKERDKRVRKMVVDLKKNTFETEMASSQRKLIEKLTLESRQEEEIRYEVYKTKSYEQIFKRKRTTRDQMYGEKLKEFEKMTKIRKEVLIEDLKLKVSQTGEVLQKAVKKLKTKDSVKVRAKKHKVCSKVVDLLLDFSEQIYDQLVCRNKQPSKKIFFTQEQKLNFINCQKLPKLSNKTEEKQESETTVKETAKIHFNNFLETSNVKEFKFEDGINPIQRILTRFLEDSPITQMESTLITETTPIFSDQTQITSPGQANMKLDLDSLNKPFGENTPNQIQILSYETKVVNTNQSEIQNGPKYDFLPLKICILGGSEKVRTNLERCLASRFGLKILRAEEEINNLLIKLKTGECKLTNRQQSLLNSLFKGNNLESKDVLNLVGEFLQREFGKRSERSYLKDLETRLSKSYDARERWRALCQEEKTNFKSIFNEERFKMSLQMRNQSLSRRSTDRGPEMEISSGMLNQQSDLKLCAPEGFILSGLPDNLDNLLSLESHFGSFEFEDKRPKKSMDRELKALEKHFASAKQETDGMKRKSMFDLIIFMESDFSRLLSEKLGRFETIEDRREVWLENLLDNQFCQEKVLELVTKMRVDDNYYALPSKYGVSVGFVQKALKFYSKNFRSNAFGLLDQFKSVETVESANNLIGKENDSPNQATITTNQSISKKSGFDVFHSRKVITNETFKVKKPPGESVILKISDSMELEKLLGKIEERVLPILEAKECFYKGLRKKIYVEGEKEKTNELKQHHISKVLKNSSLEDDTVMKNVIIKLFSEWKTNSGMEPSEQESDDWIKKIPSSLKGLLFSSFSQNRMQYRTNMEFGFLLLAEQEKRILIHQNEILNQAVHLSNLPDERDALLRRFQIDLNQFLKKWKDLISKREVKEEYHNRVFDLKCEISKMIMKKSEQISELSARVSESNLFPDEIGITLDTIARMTAQEVHRNKFAKRFTQVAKSVSNAEEEIEEWTELENEGDMEFQSLFGEGGIKERLEEVRTKQDYQEIMKEIVEWVQGELGGLDESEGGGKGGKGVVAKGKKTKEEKEVDEYTESLLGFLDQQSLKRVELLWKIGAERVDRLEKAKVNQLEQADAISKQMCQSEIRVLNSLCDFLSKPKLLTQGLYVEQEIPMQQEIKLQNNKFLVDGNHLNFLTKKKPPPRPLEPQTPNRFSISNLQNLLSSLKCQTDYENFIPTNKLLDFFNSLHLNKQLSIQLPFKWTILETKFYQKLFSTLQDFRKGAVHFKVIAIFLLYEGEAYPDDERMARILKDAEKSRMIHIDQFLTMNDYIQQTNNFDESESDAEYFDCFMFYQKFSKVMNLFKSFSATPGICVFDIFYSMMVQE